MSHLYIGCSGYLYADWRGGAFYPQGLRHKDEFAYYAGRFNTVELNSTFYRQPKESVWEGWEQRAPEGFLYAVKMSRLLTHIKQLEDPEEVWEQFYAGAQRLRDHLGPILFQLPPSLTKDVGKLERLAQVLPQELQFAFEFRHLSWFDGEVYALLRQRNWALTVVSHPYLPFVPEVTAHCVYLRFHGQKSLYSSFYSEGELAEFAGHIVGWLRAGLTVYAYFNNSARGFAAQNALTLKALVGRSVA
jgi:uncharacterized protein YecE (DUF72 family)